MNNTAASTTHSLPNVHKLIRTLKQNPTPKPSQKLQNTHTLTKKTHYVALSYTITRTKEA